MAGGVAFAVSATFLTAAPILLPAPGAVAIAVVVAVIIGIFQANTKYIENESV